MTNAVEKLISTIRANTASSLEEAQIAKIPTIYDSVLKKVDQYTYMGKTYTVGSDKSIVIIQNIPYTRKDVPDDMFDDTMVNCVSNRDVMPFMLFSDGKLIKWSDIRIIKDMHYSYLIINGTVSLTDLVVVLLPMKVVYSETDIGNNFDAGMRFDNNGLLSNSGTITFVLMLDELVMQEFTTYVKFTPLDHRVFDKNIFVFRDGLFQTNPTIEDVGPNIFKITSDGIVRTLVFCYNLYDNFSESTIMNTSIASKVVDKTYLENILIGDIWSSSANLNTARRYLGGCGLQNAALAFGGFGGTSLSTTEKFDGSIWSNTSDLNRVRQQMAACGLQNAGLVFGGSTSPSITSEKFDGSIWSNSADMIILRSYLAGCGLQNAALSFGGKYLTSKSAVTEKFDGSVWFTTGDLNTARQSLAGCGLQDAALSFGGSALSGIVGTTEKFNGSVWANTVDMNIVRQLLAGCGTQNSALSFGGIATLAGGDTEKFNGSVWSTTSNLKTAKYGLAGCGTQNSALEFGGNALLASATTEKFGIPISYSNDLKTELVLPSADDLDTSISKIMQYDNTLLTNAYIDGTLIYSNIYTGAEIKAISTDGWTSIGSKDKHGNTALIVLVNGQLYERYNEVKYEFGRYQIPTDTLLDTDTIELLFFSQYDNVIANITVPAEGIQLGDYMLGLSNKRVFSTIPLNPDYTVSQSDLAQYDVAFDISETGLLTVEAGYVGKPVTIVSDRQFKHKQYNVDSISIGMEISDTFKYCHDTSRYMVFQNGKKINKENFTVTVTKSTRPFDGLSIYLNLMGFEGDKLDVFYVPDVLIDTSITALMEINGDVIIDKTLLKYPLTKDTFMVFVNGKKIHNKQMQDISATKLKITTDIQTIKNVSVVQYLQCDIFADAFQSTTSVWDRIMDSVDDTEINKLMLSSNTITDTEVDLRKYEVPMRSVLYEIMKKYWLVDAAKVGDVLKYDFDMADFMVGPDGTLLPDLMNGNLIDKLNYMLDGGNVVTAKLGDFVLISKDSTDVLQWATVYKR